MTKEQEMLAECLESMQRAMSSFQHQITCLVCILVEHKLLSHEAWKKIVITTQPAFDQVMAEILEEVQRDRE